MITRHKLDRCATTGSSIPESARNRRPYRIKSQRRGMHTYTPSSLRPEVRMLGGLPLPSDTPVRRTRDHGFQTRRSIAGRRRIEFFRRGVPLARLGPEPVGAQRSQRSRARHGRPEMVTGGRGMAHLTGAMCEAGAIGHVRDAVRPPWLGARPAGETGQRQGGCTPRRRPNGCRRQPPGDAGTPRRD